jgi:hypothetical protein
MQSKLITKLKKATKGLLYPSEYDSPLEPFIWEAADNTLESVRRLSGEPANAPHRLISAEVFFEEVKETEGFPALYETLKALLTDLRVYRFGQANIKVYLVGRSEDGRLAGLRTLSVET